MARRNLLTRDERERLFQPRTDHFSIVELHSACRRSRRPFGQGALPDLTKDHLEYWLKRISGHSTNAGLDP